MIITESFNWSSVIVNVLNLSLSLGEKQWSVTNPKRWLHMTYNYMCVLMTSDYHNVLVSVSECIGFVKILKVLLR